MAIPLDDFKSSAIGWPRTLSEYKDAAEVIWSTTKMRIFCLSKFSNEFNVQTSKSIRLTKNFKYRWQILTRWWNIDMWLTS